MLLLVGLRRPRTACGGRSASRSACPGRAAGNPTQPLRLPNESQRAEGEAQKCSTGNLGRPAVCMQRESAQMAGRLWIDIALHASPHPRGSPFDTPCHKCHKFSNINVFDRSSAALVACRVEMMNLRPHCQGLAILNRLAPSKRQKWLRTTFHRLRTRLHSEGL